MLPSLARRLLISVATKRVLPRLSIREVPSSFCSASFYRTSKGIGDMNLSNWKSYLQNLQTEIRWSVKEFLRTTGFLLKYSLESMKGALVQRRSFQEDLHFRLFSRVDIVNQVVHCGSWSSIMTTKFEEELLHLWDAKRFVACNCLHDLLNKWRRTGCRLPVSVEFLKQWPRSNLAQSGYTTRKAGHLPGIQQLCISTSSFPLAMISAIF